MHQVKTWIARELPAVKVRCEEELGSIILNQEEGNSLQDYVFSMIDKHIKEIKVRSSFTIVAYRFLREMAKARKARCKAIKKETLDQIAFVAEASMTMMYMYNDILDNKAEVKNCLHYKIMVPGTNIFRDLLLDYINELDISTVQKLKVQDIFRKAYKQVNSGQIIDKSFRFDSLVYNKEVKNINESLRNDELDKILLDIQALKDEFPGHDNLFDVYFTRIYLTNSSLLKALVEVIVYLTGYEGRGRKQLEGFAEMMGLYMQIVNDCKDFVLDVKRTWETGEKPRYHSNVLSDLHNETVSLPIALHYLSQETVSTNIVNQFIHDRLRDPNRGINQYQFELRGQHNKILKEIIESKGLTRAMAVGRAIAIKAIDYLKAGLKAEWEHTEQHQHLRVLAGYPDMAFNNRYYFHIWKAKAAYKSHRFYRCEDYLFAKKTSCPKGSAIVGI